MRRTLPVMIGLAAVLGLAAPAMAADTTLFAPPTVATSTATRPAAIPEAITLRCAVTTTAPSPTANTAAAKPAIHCEWSAFAGAAAYRVRVVALHGRRGEIRFRVTKETSFTTRAVRPGRYAFVVVAVGADRKPLARSNRVGLVIERPGRNAAANSSRAPGAVAPAA